MLKEAINGELSLARAFWGLGVVGTPLIAILFFVIPKILPLGTWGMVLALLLLIVWSLIVVVAVWRSSNRHPTPVYWKWLARIVAMIGAGGIFLFIGMLASMTDFNSNSFNIQSKIEYDSAYPHIGFWKTECSETHGFVVEKAGEGNYFVRFCGPGGCFAKNSFSKVKFGEHPFYQLLDNRSIGVKAANFDFGKLEDKERKEMEAQIKDGMVIFKKCS